MQILDGLLLNAWRHECTLLGYTSLDKFAQAKPTPAAILKIAETILRKHATPKEDLQPKKPRKTPTPAQGDDFDGKK